MGALVGTSSRTPFKHWILDYNLGKVAGVLSLGNASVPARANPFLCIDMCAGDGEITDSHQCSPYIINKHCMFLHKRGKKVRSVLIEAQANTYEKLCENMRSMFPEGLPYEHEILHADAREFVVEPTCENQAIFINCDPNSISDLPFNARFAKSLTKTTTFTTTLGCNANGIKRMSFEKRSKWFDYIKYMTEDLPSWHDAILVRLVKDASMWAYLTRLPEKWSRETCKKMKDKGDLMWPNGVDVASIRRNCDEFRKMAKELFLTQKELRDDAN